MTERRVEINMGSEFIIGAGETAYVGRGPSMGEEPEAGEWFLQIGKLMTGDLGELSRRAVSMSVDAYGNVKITRLSKTNAVEVKVRKDTHFERFGEILDKEGAFHEVGFSDDFCIIVTAHNSDAILKCKPFDVYQMDPSRTFKLVYGFHPVDPNVCGWNV